MDLIRKARILGLRIMNGNMEGDELGEYSHIGPTSKLVIDYSLANDLGWELVDSIEIKDNSESDHLPMILTAERGAQLGTRRKEPEIRRTADWSKKGLEEYKDHLEKVSWDKVLSTEDLQREIRKVGMDDSSKKYRFSESSFAKVSIMRNRFFFKKNRNRFFVIFHFTI